LRQLPVVFLLLVFLILDMLITPDYLNS